MTLLHIRRTSCAKYTIRSPFSHHNMVETVACFGMPQLIVLDRHRRGCSARCLSERRGHMMTGRRKRRLSLDIILMFSFGVLALIALFVIGLIVDQPNQLLSLVSRVTLALACAGIAAMLPGFVQLNITPHANVAIRAGGAVAIFVLVYLVDPGSQLQSNSKACEVPAAPHNNFMPVVEDWNTKIEAREYAKAYISASSWTRNQYTLEFMKTVYENFSREVGNLKSRTLIGSNSTQQLPDGVCGNFRVITYLTEFENGGELSENFIVMIENQKWVVRDHRFSSPK